MRRFRKFSLTIAVAASLLQFSVIPAVFAWSLPAVTAQPGIGPEVESYFIHPGEEPELRPGAIEHLLQQRIKYVFVIFNENHSFDNEYGTFPGVNGLYSDGQKPRSAANTPGFTQTYTDVIAV